MENKVTVYWENQSTVWWNQICADIMEVFGLPGGRYVSVPTEDYMEFTFNNPKDAELCRVLISHQQ